MESDFQTWPPLLTLAFPGHQSSHLHTHPSPFQNQPRTLVVFNPRKILILTLKHSSFPTTSRGNNADPNLPLGLRYPVGGGTGTGTDRTPSVHLQGAYPEYLESCLCPAHPGNQPGRPGWGWRGGGPCRRGARDPGPFQTCSERLQPSNHRPSLSGPPPQAGADVRRPQTPAHSPACERLGRQKSGGLPAVRGMERALAQPRTEKAQGRCLQPCLEGSGVGTAGRSQGEGPNQSFASSHVSAAPPSLGCLCGSLGLDKRLSVALPLCGSHHGSQST